MKVGLGLYRHMLNRDHYRFARQAGATHIIAHLVDYFKGATSSSAADQPVGGDRGWGIAGDPNALWSLEDLLVLRREIESEGLKLEAIENFDPAHWHDVLLDGPRKREQLDNLKTIIRRVGEAGIPVMGYNFSIAGVCGRISGPFARGGANSVGMDEPLNAPIPNGMVWNMVYDPNAPCGTLPSTSRSELWRRFEEFLVELLPVAEEAGVKLAAHPDDPPLPVLREQARLVFQPEYYERLAGLSASPSNALEFCIGSIAEMTEGDIYQTVQRFSSLGRIGYVHFRNVRGKVPAYRESFVDDGDVDMLRVVRILHRNNYDGVIIPDHTPQMTCAAPWHAGMAFALGYIRACIQAAGIIERDDESR